MSTRAIAHATWRRALLTLTATSAALAALTVPATAATAHDHENSAYTITINGSNAYPESVAADNHYIYTGSIDNGTVYRGRLGAKTLDPPSGQDGRTEVTGVKITGNRLLVAGAFTGRFFIYTSTGKLVSSYTVPDTGEKTLVNDEAVTPNGDVYITDSFRAVLYRIPAAEVNAPATGAHRTLQVAYHLPDYVAGQSNGNGIVAAPDGKSVIIGYWYSGALYRLTLATGEVSTLPPPDGDQPHRRAPAAHTREPCAPRTNPPHAVFAHVSGAPEDPDKDHSYGPTRAATVLQNIWCPRTATLQLFSGLLHPSVHSDPSR